MKWHYAVRRIHEPHLERDLNDLGAQGWQVIHIEQRDPSTWLVILSRPWDWRPN